VESSSSLNSDPWPIRWDPAAEDHHPLRRFSACLTSSCALQLLDLTSARQPFQGSLIGWR